MRPLQVALVLAIALAAPHFAPGPSLRCRVYPTQPPIWTPEARLCPGVHQKRENRPFWESRLCPSHTGPKVWYPRKCRPMDHDPRLAPIPDTEAGNPTKNLRTA